MSESAGRSELVLYATEDGAARFFLRAQDGSVWLSQIELAELFQTSVPNINIHIKNVFEEGELSEVRTVKEDLMVRAEGARQVRRTVKLYNLDMILAIGYRVNQVGVQLLHFLQQLPLTASPIRAAIESAAPFRWAMGGAHAA